MKSEKQTKQTTRAKELEKEKCDCAAEQTATITQNEDFCAEATSYGKFKTLDELLKAYRELQSQFTKRSQRLSELLNENGALREKLLALQQKCGGLDEEQTDLNSSSSSCLNDISAEDETGNARDIEGVKASELSDFTAYENEGRNVKIEQNETFVDNSPTENDFDCSDYSVEAKRFLRANPFAAAYVCEIADAAAASGDLSAGFLERAFISVLSEKLKTATKNANDADKIFEAVMAHRDVYERVIRRYLTEIDKNRVATLICAEGLTACAPPVKPKSIEEAGAFAASMLKRK